MSNSIRTNTASESIRQALGKVTHDETRDYIRLASGKRITQAGDDPAGLAIGNKLEAHVRGLRQATRNANHGISFVQTGEGALNEISSILIRMRELGIQAASDTYGEQERMLIDEEYQQLILEVDRIADSSEYNGYNLLNGENSEGLLSFQIGPNAGEENQIEWDANAVVSTTDELEISDLSVAEIDDARATLENIDAAIDKVSGFRAKMGALQSRLTSTASNLENMTIANDEAKSRIEDTDFAETSSHLVNMRILKEAGISALSGAHNMRTSLLKLL